MSNILAKLMLNHPSLNVLVQVSNACYDNDDKYYSWGQLDTRNCCIAKVYRGEKGVYLEDEYEPYEIFEKEYNITMDDFELHEKDFEDFLDKLKKSWERVIVIYVDPIGFSEE